LLVLETDSVVAPADPVPETELTPEENKAFTLEGV
jgi:hypothetical protein